MFVVEENYTMTEIEDLFEQALRLKRNAEEAEKLYRECNTLLLEAMTDVNLNQYTNNNGDKVQIMEQEINVVDVLSYRDQVTEQEFMESVKVSVEQARKLLPQRNWSSCINKTGEKRFIKITPTKSL